MKATSKTAALPSIVALGSCNALKQKKVIDRVIWLSRSLSSAPNVLDVYNNSSDKFDDGLLDIISAEFSDKGCIVKHCNPSDFHTFKAWADVIIYRHDYVVQSTFDLIDAIESGAVLCAIPKVLQLLLYDEIMPPGTAIIGAHDKKKIDDLMNSNSKRRVIGVDDSAALVFVGRDAMAIGGGEDSTCHVYTRNEYGETIAGPLPTTWDEPIPIEEVLQFPMPAKASHLESLVSHVDTNFVIADNVLEKAALMEEECRDDEGQVFPKIVAAGRSETLQMRAIIDKVIELSGTDLPKVLYVGTASFDRTDKFLRQTKAFREMGCEIRRLDVSEKDTVPTSEEMKELVTGWAEVIMCSGGNTLHALLRWKEVGLDWLMKEASLKGVVLCGGSAGAGCWFSSLHTDSLRPDNTKNKEHVLNELSEEELADWDYTKISALGFVNSMCVPHFDATGTNGMKRSEHAAELLKKNPTTSAIGIENNAALVIVGNEALAVSGDGKATCHVVVPDAETGELMSAPLPKSWEHPVPVEEILDFPIPATASHLEALEDHVDTNFVVADDIAQAISEPANNNTQANADKTTSSVPQIKIVASGNERGMRLQPIVDKVIELSGTDLPKVLYVGTASFDRTDKFLRQTKAFREMGCEIRRLDVSEKDTVPTSEEMKELVTGWAEVIMCSGGNTLHALLRWKEVGLDWLMKEASLKGVVLCGGSAGAGCWFSSLHTDSLRPDNTKNKEHVLNELSEEELADWDYTKISALGFVNSMCVPHFDATGTNGMKRSEHAAELLKKNPTTSAIGIENNAALVIVGNEALAVSGDGKATCHVVVPDAETGELMSAPLPKSWEHPVPVEEILDFPIPATASHLEALEDHVDTNFVVADDIAQAISEPANNNTQANADKTTSSVPQIKIVASGNERGMRLQPIVDKVIELSGTDLPKVLYVGTASFDRTDKFLRQTKAFREMGCEIRRLDVSEKDTVPTSEEMKELVTGWAEVIMCSGGNTLHALLRWKEVGLDWLMKEASLKGVVLCGGSAGAGCWFSSLHTDSLRPDNTKNKEHVLNELSEEELADWDYTKISALGFVNSMCVPHFDATGTNGMKRSEHAAELLKKNPTTSAIGIENNAALVIVGNEALAVSGDGKATCHVVVPDAETGELMSAPLPKSWEHPVPVEEILDFPIPATASHLEALEDHVDTNFVVADDIAQAISEPANNNTQANADKTTSSVPQIKIVASGNERGMRLQPIVDKVIELSGSDLPKVLYVGTASFDRTDKFLRQTKAFREMGCEIRRLDVSEKDTVPTSEEMKELVTGWAEVIMCSGGNTLHALLRWKEVGLDLLMKEASLKGIVLCGGSAGAGCWFSSLHTDSLRPDNTKNKEHVLNELSEEELADWDYIKISALGFLPAMMVPHFDKRAEHAAELLKKNPTTPAIGIENNAALVIVGNEALAVSGDGKATCHVVVPDEETGEFKSSALVVKPKRSAGHKRISSTSDPILVIDLLG